MTEQESNRSSEQVSVEGEDLLDAETRQTAASALLAYHAMETTKRRHFDYLSQIETKKKKFNLQATQAEHALLVTLLADHDQAVKNFQQQTRQLLQTQPRAHAALFEYIGLLNSTLPDSVTH